MDGTKYRTVSRIIAAAIILAFISALLGVMGIIPGRAGRLLLWGTLIACYAFVLYDNLRLKVGSKKIIVAETVSLLAGIAMSGIHTVLSKGFDWAGALQAASFGFMISALIYMVAYRKIKPETGKTQKNSNLA